MKIYIGTDHAGFEMKEHLKVYVRSLGYEVEDLGAHTLNLADDYPDFVIPVALAVAHDEESRGIVLGASGQGEAMCANRTKGVRAVVYYGGTDDFVQLAREHNNANILSLGARFLSLEEAEKAVTAFITTSFTGEERHVRRLSKF